MHRTLPLLLMFFLPLLSGCEAEPPSRQELGRIVFNPAEVPGADKPYTLPEYLRNAPPAPEPPKRAPGD
jgi:hypothetical protein